MPGLSGEAGVGDRGVEAGRGAWVMGLPGDSPGEP